MSNVREIREQGRDRGARGDSGSKRKTHGSRLPAQTTGLAVFFGLWAAAAQAAHGAEGLHSSALGDLAIPIGALENPQPDSHQSGIGLLSGWACDAIEVTATIDDTWQLHASYGTERADTRDVCGDTDNGFGLLYNWSLLGDGDHTVVVRANAVEIGRATIHVHTLGEPFMAHANERVFHLPNFPWPGTSTSVQWQMAQQSFVIRPPTNASPVPRLDKRARAASRAGPISRIPGNLENPSPTLPQSGISLLSGWLCEANEVLIQIDEFDPLPAAYGTDREDTQAICGDSNNGYGLLFNWSLLLDGPHMVRVLADGQEVARSHFSVATFGTTFLTDGSTDDFPIADFPGPGQSVVLRWQPERQNFVIVETHM